MLLFLLYVLSVIWFSLMGYIVYRCMQVRALEDEFIKIAHGMKVEREQRQGTQ